MTTRLSGSGKRQNRLIEVGRPEVGRVADPAELKGRVSYDCPLDSVNTG